MKFKSPFLWTLFAFVLRLVVGLIIHVYSLESGYEGFVPVSNYGDDIFYWEVANELLQGYDSSLELNLYPSFLASIFHITGPNILIGKFINILLNSFSVLIGIFIAKEILRTQFVSKKMKNFTVNFTGAWLSLYPSELFYSTQMIKDPFLIFCGMLNIYAALILLDTTKSKWLAALMWILSLVGAFLFRPYAAFALAISFFLYLIFVWRTNIYRKLILVVVLLALAAILPIFAGAGVFAMNYIFPWLDLQKISEFREAGYSTGGSAADIALDYTSPIGFITSYGFSAATVMFGPFLWQLKSPIQFIAFPESLLTLSLAVSIAFKAFKFRLAQYSMPSKSTFLLIFSVVLMLVIALFSDSIGGNTRLRILSWNIFYIYVAVFISEFQSARKPSRPNLFSRKTAQL